MGAKSNYLEAALVDEVLGGTDFTPPATVYVALSTADPTEDGSGLAEPSGNNYARKAVTNDGTNWPAGNPKSNGTAITFATPSGTWGAVTHFAIFDAASAGNMLYFGALTVPKTINNGDTVSFGIGALSITED